jgi:ribosomal protein S18 acetylase RimI-like enzyme
LQSFITLKPVTTDDLPALLAISRDTFFTAFHHRNNADDMEAYSAKNLTLQKLGDELQTRGSSFYFAVLSDEITGFIKLNTGNAQNEFKDQNSLEIERLYVLAQHQRKQIGQQMLAFAFDVAAKAQCDYVWLGVWEHNHEAIRLYERQGFVHCGSHNFMLGNDLQTDVLMQKDIA